MNLRPRLMYLWWCATIVLCLSNSVAAATVTWDGGGGDGVWTNPINWSSDIAPSAADDVVLTGTGAISINAPVSVGSITLASGFTGIVTQGASVSVARQFQIVGGGWSSGSQTMSIGGNVDIVDRSGAFQATTGSVVLTGTGTLSNPNGGNAFANLTTAPAGKSTRVLSDLTITKLLTVGAGLCDVRQNAATRLIHLRGTGQVINKIGSIQGWFPNGCELWFESDGSAPMELPGMDYGQCAIRMLARGNASATFTQKGAITNVHYLTTATESMTQRVTWTTNSYPITLTVFLSTGYQGSGGGTTWNAGSSIINTGSNFCWFTSPSDIVNLENAQITAPSIAPWTSTTTVNPGSSTVTLTGAPIGVSWITRPQRFWNLILAGSSTTSVTSYGDLLVGNDLTITGGTLASGANTVSVQGNLTVGDAGKLSMTTGLLTVGKNLSFPNVAGAFTAGSGSVQLLNTGTLSNPHASNNFYNLTTAPSGRSTRLLSDLVITNHLRVGSGLFDIRQNTALRNIHLRGAGQLLSLATGGSIQGWFPNGAQLWFEATSTTPVEIPGLDYGQCGIGLRTFGAVTGTYNQTGAISNAHYLATSADTATGRTVWNTNNYPVSLTVYLRTGSDNSVGGTTWNVGTSVVETGSNFCWFTHAADVINLQSSRVSAGGFATWVPQIQINPGTSTVIARAGVGVSWLPHAHRFANLELANTAPAYLYGPIQCSGDVSVGTGGLLAGGNLQMDGASSAMLAQAGPGSFASVSIAKPGGLHLATGLSTQALSMTAGSQVWFDAQQMVSAGIFTAIGTETAPIRLQSSVPGLSWGLQAAAGSPATAWVQVSESNASSGITIDATNHGTDLGQNQNWNFGVVVMPQVAQPTLSLPGGTYGTEQTVTLTCATPGVTYRYSLDGGDPTQSNLTTTARVDLTQGATLRVVAELPGFRTSIEADAATYTFQVQPVTVSIPAGTYTTTCSVTPTCSTAQVAFHVGTDAAPPDAQTPETVGPIAVSESQTLVILATRPGWLPSIPLTVTYTLQVPTDGLVITPVSQTSLAPITATVSVPSGTTVRYTLDGSTPAATSTTVTGSIAITESATLQVRAFRLGWEPSLAVTAMYTIRQKPVITWPIPVAITYGTRLSATQLNAQVMGAIAGNWIYTPAIDTKLPAGMHNLTVEFTPNDLVNYQKATASVDIMVQKAMPQMIWSAPLGTLIAGLPLDPVLVNAQADIPGVFTYNPLPNSVLQAGDQDWSASFVPQDQENYQSAAQVIHVHVLEQVAPVTVSLPAGSYIGAQLVLLNCATPGAVIYYTFDGSAPSAVGKSASGNIELPGTCVLKAIAMAEGKVASAMTTVEYALQVAPPQATPGAGPIEPHVSVTMSGSANATIHFTLDGTAPNESSTTYVGPITVIQSCTLRMKAFQAGWLPSATIEVPYTVASRPVLDAPTITPEQGIGIGSLLVKADSHATNVILRYTRDGSVPDTASMEYPKTGLNILSDTLLTVRAFSQDGSADPSLSAFGQFQITPTVAWTEEAKRVREDAGSVKATVRLSAPCSRKIDIPYTLSGTASAVDYTLNAGIISIEAQSVQSDVVIPILDNNIYQGDRTLSLSLGRPTNAVLDNISVWTLTIEDNDSIPKVGFVSGIQAVQADVTAFDVPIRLDHPTNQTVSLQVTVSGGSAVNGKDYSIASNQVTIPAGQTNGSLHAAVLPNDTLLSPDIILNIGQLANAEMGSVTTTQVVIQRKAVNPSISWDAPAYLASEHGGTVHLKAILNHVTNAPIIVPVTATNGTAILSQDYSIPSGEIVIPAGSTEGQFDIGITKHDTTLVDRAFTVTLGASMGVALGDHPVAAVTISQQIPTTIEIVRNPVMDNGADRIAPGGTAVLSAIIRDQAGRVIDNWPAAVVWSATDGTMTDNGIFTAPPYIGSVEVSASVAGPNGQVAQSSLPMHVDHVLFIEDPILIDSSPLVTTKGKVGITVKNDGSPYFDVQVQWQLPDGYWDGEFSYMYPYGQQSAIDGDQTRIQYATGIVIPRPQDDASQWVVSIPVSVQSIDYSNGYPIFGDTLVKTLKIDIRRMYHINIRKTDSQPPQVIGSQVEVPYQGGVRLDATRSDQWGGSPSNDYASDYTWNTPENVSRTNAGYMSSDAAGSYLISVQSTKPDCQGTEFTLIMDEAPEVTITAPRTKVHGRVVCQSQMYTQEGIASIVWSATGPAAVSKKVNAQVNSVCEFTMSAPGAYDISCTYTTNSGLSVSDHITIVNELNSAPLVEGPIVLNGSLDLANRVSLLVPVIDDFGYENLTYQWQLSPSSTAVYGADASFFFVDQNNWSMGAMVSGRASANLDCRFYAAGTYRAKVQIMDEDGAVVVAENDVVIPASSCVPINGIVQDANAIVVVSSQDEVPKGIDPKRSGLVFSYEHAADPGHDAVPVKDLPVVLSTEGPVEINDQKQLVMTQGSSGNANITATTSTGITTMCKFILDSQPPTFVEQPTIVEYSWEKMEVLVRLRVADDNDLKFTKLSCEYQRQGMGYWSSLPATWNQDGTEVRLSIAYIGSGLVNVRIKASDIIGCNDYDPMSASHVTYSNVFSLTMQPSLRASVFIDYYDTLHRNGKVFTQENVSLMGYVSDMAGIKPSYYAGVGDLAWSINGPEGAIISGMTFKAIRSGVYHLTATPSQGGVPGSMDITVEEPRLVANTQSLALWPETQSRIELKVVDRSWRLGAQVDYSKVRWNVNPEGAVLIDDNNRITAKIPGPAVITANVGDAWLPCSILVKISQPELIVSSDKTMFNVGDRVVTNLVARDGVGNGTTHLMDAASIGWLVLNGEAHLVEPGVYIIDGNRVPIQLQAVKTGYASNVCTINVNHPPKIGAISIKEELPSKNDHITLSVDAQDPEGINNLVYHWSVASPLITTSSCAPNHQKAISETTFTATMAATYRIHVIVEDPLGLTDSTDVDVPFISSLTSLHMLPSDMSLDAGRDVNLLESIQIDALDQFKQKVQVPPGLVWTVSGANATSEGTTLHAGDVNGGVVITAQFNDVHESISANVSGGKDPENQKNGISANAKATLSITSGLTGIQKETVDGETVYYTKNDSVTVRVSLQAAGCSIASYQVLGTNASGAGSTSVQVPEGDLTVVATVLVTDGTSTQSIETDPIHVISSKTVPQLTFQVKESSDSDESFVDVRMSKDNVADYIYLNGSKNADNVSTRAKWGINCFGKSGATIIGRQAGICGLNVDKSKFFIGDTTLTATVKKDGDQGEYIDIAGLSSVSDSIKYGDDLKISSAKDPYLFKAQLESKSGVTGDVEYSKVWVDTDPPKMKIAYIPVGFKEGKKLIAMPDDGLQVSPVRFLMGTADLLWVQVNSDGAMSDALKLNPTPEGLPGSSAVGKEIFSNWRLIKPVSLTENDDGTAKVDLKVIDIAGNSASLKIDAKIKPFSASETLKVYETPAINSTDEPTECTLDAFKEQVVVDSTPSKIRINLKGTSSTARLDVMKRTMNELSNIGPISDADTSGGGQKSYADIKVDVSDYLAIYNRIVLTPKWRDWYKKNFTPKGISEVVKAFEKGDKPTWEPLPQDQRPDPIKYLHLARSSADQPKDDDVQHIVKLDVAGSVHPVVMNIPPSWQTEAGDKKDLEISYEAVERTKFKWKQRGRHTISMNPKRLTGSMVLEDSKYYNFDSGDSVTIDKDYYVQDYGYWNYLNGADSTVSVEIGLKNIAWSASAAFDDITSYSAKPKLVMGNAPIINQTTYGVCPWDQTTQIMGGNEYSIYTKPRISLSLDRKNNIWGFARCAISRTGDCVDGPKLTIKETPRTYQIAANLKFPVYAVEYGWIQRWYYPYPGYPDCYSYWMTEWGEYAWQLTGRSTDNPTFDDAYYRWAKPEAPLSSYYKASESAAYVDPGIHKHKSGYKTEGNFRWFNSVGIINDIVATGGKTVIRIRGGFIDKDNTFDSVNGKIASEQAVWFINDGQDISSYDPNAQNDPPKDKIRITNQRLVASSANDSLAPVLEITCDIGSEVNAGKCHVDIKVGAVHAYPDELSQQYAGANGAHRMKEALAVIQYAPSVVKLDFSTGKTMNIDNEDESSGMPFPNIDLNITNCELVGDPIQPTGIRVSYSLTFQDNVSELARAGSEVKSISIDVNGDNAISIPISYGVGDTYRQRTSNFIKSGYFTINDPKSINFHIIAHAKNAAGYRGFDQWTLVMMEDTALTNADGDHPCVIVDPCHVSKSPNGELTYLIPTVQYKTPFDDSVPNITLGSEKMAAQLINIEDGE